MRLTKRALARIIDIVGTLAFALIFIPAAAIMTVALLPLAVTLRALRWCNNGR